MCSSCCAAAGLQTIVVEIVVQEEPLSVMGRGLKSNGESAQEVRKRVQNSNLSNLSQLLQALQQSTGVLRSESRALQC